MKIQRSAKCGPAVEHGLGRPCQWLFRVSFVALAATVVLATGCLAAPPKTKKEPAVSPPVAPENSATNTLSVDLTKAYEQNTFHQNVTPEQRVHVHLDLGRVFESRGNHEAALMEYEQALEACEKKSIGRSRSADLALAHRRIAGSLDRLGRFAQAEVHYKKAIKLSPKDPKIWNDAGYSYYLQGRWADAARALKTAAKLAPEDSRIMTNLGLTLAAAGKTEEALPLLSQYSGDAVGHANLGFLLAATGQVEMARQQYLQALALRPSMSIAQRALQQLDRVASVASTNAVASKKQGDVPRAPLAPARAPSDGSVVTAASPKPADAPQPPLASPRAPNDGSTVNVARPKPANAAQAPSASARGASDRSMVTVTSPKPAETPKAAVAPARPLNDGSVVKTQATRRQIPPPSQSNSVDLFSPSAGESSRP